MNAHIFLKHLDKDAAFLTILREFTELEDLEEKTGYLLASVDQDVCLKCFTLANQLKRDVNHLLRLCRKLDFRHYKRWGVEVVSAASPRKNSLRDRNRILQFSSNISSLHDDLNILLLAVIGHTGVFNKAHSCDDLLGKRETHWFRIRLCMQLLAFKLRRMRRTLVRVGESNDDEDNSDGEQAEQQR